ncbi:very short patch repair endonuclease [Edaphobacter lichenicola]|uniref:very short patch repair endonuclease n=1 Tax=Tunturiibacter empetritectus TaxID=3069691 RepID=UPI001C862782
MKLTPESRSKIMSAIRSRGNASTELRFANLLRVAHITGWRRHQNLPGRPDFAFRREKIAIFIDGCFWHACPRCAKVPRQNQDYWGPKLARNKERDLRVTAELGASGWTVLRVWEHQLKTPASVLQRIDRALKKPLSSSRQL